VLPAIVLAAGASSRMGRPKALLPIDGQTFISRIVHTLHDGGVARVAVVVRPSADQIRAEAAAAAAEIVVNPDPDRGQLSSLQAGLEAVDSAAVEGVLVTLVDVPLVSAKTVATLLERARTSSCPILRAACRGRNGHPVIFMRAVFEALRRADPSAGAKPVVRSYPVEDVEVDDPGVAEDVDTPADYRRLVT
jgi:molybdenum cofactor cytidylyltransferase